MPAGAVTSAHPMPEQTGQHTPERPSWDCAKCGQTWPCANAKSDLLAEYASSRAAMRIYLAIGKWNAFEDYAASGEIPEDLHDRFLGWLGW